MGIEEPRRARLGVPTDVVARRVVAESGIRDLQTPLYRAWLGYAAAAGVPPDAAGKLQNALLTALRSAEVREAFAAVGFQVVGSSPQEFAAAIRAELARNRKLIDSGAIKVE